jgi:transposase
LQQHPTQEIAQALDGDYCPEHLLPFRRRGTFTTAISSRSWNVIDVSKRTHSALEAKVSVWAPDLSQMRSTEKRQQAVQRHHLEQMTGADLTKLLGLDLLAVERILSEIGPDMSRRPSEKHFCAHNAAVRFSQKRKGPKRK